jgi:AAA+ superfamily predicted ATPase
MSGSRFPEQAGSNPGISFEVNELDVIYRAATRGDSGQLAYALLERPVKEISIDLISNTATFDLTAITDFQAATFNQISSHKVLEAMSERALLARASERGGHYIVRGPRGTRLVVAVAILGLSGLSISTGKVNRSGQEPIELVPSPELTEDNFRNGLYDTLDLLSALLDTSYSLAKKKPPNETISVTAPRRVGRMLGLFSKIEVERPTTTFDEIGGQPEAKREILSLSFALSNPSLYSKWGTKPPKGVLLYGPPGTGKTLLAKALAAQANARFLHVRASDIGSKWYGESEQLVQQIFDEASKGGKTILFFDELDSIMPRREGRHEATQRVIGTLLQNIDGIGANDDVMIVGATNRREAIDEAMLRPGRLDRWVEVGLPEAEGREHILTIHLERACAVAERRLFDQLDLATVAAQAEGFSGADLAEIIRRALEEKVRQEGSGETPSLLITADLLREINNFEGKQNPNRQ